MAVEGARCAEHQAPAGGACIRCGTFICPACNWQSYCSTCFQLHLPDDARAQRIQKWARWSWLAFLLAAVAVLIPCGALFTPFLFVGGIGAGVFALVRREGAPKVIVPAWVGISLNGIGLAAMISGFIAGWQRVRGRH